MKRESPTENRGGEVVKRIRDEGLTLAGWSRRRGFVVVTVSRIIHGRYSGLGPVSLKILKSLREDGYLRAREEKTLIRKSA